MRLLGLSAKNATVKWWRSLTLGFLIFSVSLVLVISNSLILAVKNRTETAISSGITGHVQIRSDRSTEDDMVVQYSIGWDAIKPMRAETIRSISDVVGNAFPSVRKFLMARQSAFLNGGNKREETMLLGIEPEMASYRDTFILKSGRYLEPGDTGCILLTEEQAAAFGVNVGDTVTISAKNRFGLNSKAEYRVVGIGNFLVLSLFSYKACYLDINSVRELVGLDSDEATDIILFSDPGEDGRNLMKSLAAELENAGIDNVIAAEEKLSSDDLKVDDIDFDQLEEEDDGKVKLSVSEDMGKMFRGFNDSLTLMLNIMVLLLMVIVVILIINLVFTIGMERYSEIGTLRAMGFSKFQVIRIFLGEILSVSMLACIAGTAVGTALVLIVGNAGISLPVPMLEFILGKTLSMEINMSSLAVDAGIIAAFSLAASFYPAYKACSIDPAQAIRTV